MTSSGMRKLMQSLLYLSHPALPLREQCHMFMMASIPLSYVKSIHFVQCFVLLQM